MARPPRLANMMGVAFLGSAAAAWWLGAETLGTVLGAMVAALAAFAHGGTIGALIAFAAGVNPFIFNGTRNGAIAHLVVADNEWVIRSFNDAAHVGPLTADAEPPT